MVAGSVDGIHKVYRLPPPRALKTALK